MFAGKLFLLTSSDVKHKDSSRNDSEGNCQTFMSAVFNVPYYEIVWTLRDASATKVIY